MADLSAQRTRDAILGLAHRGLDVRAFSRGAAQILRRAIVFDGFCVMTMDPGTLPPTGHVIENGLPETATPRLAEIEMLDADFNKFTGLARGSAAAASRSAATGGDLWRSTRQRELRRPHGLGDELRAALADDSGTWGGIVLMREAGRPALYPLRRPTRRLGGRAAGRRSAARDAAHGGDRGSRSRSRRRPPAARARRLDRHRQHHGRDVARRARRRRRPERPPPVRDPDRGRAREPSRPDV